QRLWRGAGIRTAPSRRPAGRASDPSSRSGFRHAPRARHSWRPFPALRAHRTARRRKRRAVDLPPFPLMKAMSPWQFTLFRILFGGYLAYHFAELVPYAVELFSAEGLLKDPRLNPTSGLFPNPLAIELPGWAVTGSVAI